MTLSRRHPLTLGLATALLLTAGVAPVWGQETDHASHHPAAKPAAAQSPANPVDPHASDHAHHATQPVACTHDVGCRSRTRPVAGRRRRFVTVEA